MIWFVQRKIHKMNATRLQRDPDYNKTKKDSHHQSPKKKVVIKKYNKWENEMEKTKKPYGKRIKNGKRKTTSKSRNFKYIKMEIAILCMCIFQGLNIFPL